jgi:hypothetical protein
MGFTHISEDSSEIAFLLVENYNHDHSRFVSGRPGNLWKHSSFEYEWNLTFVFHCGLVLDGLP